MAAGRTLVFFAQQSDVRPLLRAVSGEERSGLIAVAASKSLADGIAGRGLACGCLDEYLDLPAGDEVRKTAIEWLDAWADQPRVEGRSYKELAALDGIGLWWFMLPVLVPDALRCVQFVEALKEMVRVERPDQVVLVDVARRLPYPLRLWLDDNLPGKVAQLVCQERGTAVRKVRPGVLHAFSWLTRLGKTRLSVWVYYAWIRHVVAFCRIWLSRETREKCPDETAASVALVSSPVYWRQTIGRRGQVIVDDAIAGSSVRALVGRGYRVLGIDVDLAAPNWKQFDILRQKRGQQGIAWRAVEWYQRFTSKEARRARRKKIREISRLAGTGAISEWGMSYGGIRLDGLLASRFAFLYQRYIDQSLEYMNALQHALEREKIALFLLVYEEGAPGRAATLLGQRRGVPTVALQHGALSSPYTPAYYMAQASTKAVGDPVPCPVPTTTAVYGEHMRSLLVETSSYPPESVAVVGWPAYDGVVEMLQGMAQGDSRQALGLAAKIPLVLVVSQPFLTRENWVHFAQVVLGAATLVPEARWAVKLHPSEQAEAWQERIGSHDLADRVAVYDGDLHRLLSACDAVVSWFSTVILEAALCGKPAISVEIPGCLAPTDYLRDGLVTGADGAEDLAQTLCELMAGGARREEWVNRSARALEKYVHRPDGRASQRVADLVASHIAAFRSGQ